MKPKPNANRHNPGYRRSFFYILMPLLFCFFCANAQVKKPAERPVKKEAATTLTPVKTKTEVAVKADETLVLDQVLHSSVKRPALGEPEYEKTAKHQKRKAAHEKVFSDTAKMHMNGITIKLVKNPRFGALSAPSYNAKTAKGSKHNEKKTNKNRTGFDCACSTVTLTANSANFLNANGEAMDGLIYPGAFYTFDNFFRGNTTPVLGKQHTMELQIAGGNLKNNDNPYINVSDPNAEKIGEGVYKLQNELGGPVANDHFNSTSYETSDAAASSLQISGGAGFAGIKVSASYGSSSSQNTHSVTIDATKILYTILALPTEEGFFVDPNVENTPDLMVMSRVSYGVRVLANFTYQTNSSADQEKFDASYSGFGSANVDLGAVSSDKNVSETINLYVVGGPGNVAPQYNRKDLETEVQKIFKEATWKNARPISYSFSAMDDSPLGSYSATDQFHPQNCVPDNGNTKLESVYITYKTGTDDKRTDDHYNVMLYPGTALSRNNFNGYNNYPQPENNSEPYLAGYKTGPLNVYFPMNSSHEDPMAISPYRKTPTMDDFVRYGGRVHFHIFPNGSDTWDISTVILTLNFTGGLVQTVTWGGQGNALVLSEGSTEGDLLFTGAFKPR